MSFITSCILLIVVSTLGKTEEVFRTITSRTIDTNQNDRHVDNQIHDAQLTPRYKEKRNTDATASPRYNLLGILMNKVAKLTRIITFSMSEQTRKILSETIGSILSVIFGAYSNILWPIFADASVWFFKLLTS